MSWDTFIFKDLHSDMHDLDLISLRRNTSLHLYLWIEEKPQCLKANINYRILYVQRGLWWALFNGVSNSSGYGLIRSTAFQYNLSVSSLVHLPLSHFGPQQ